YAIVQGVDHVVPVDMYLPGCPPRPEMLIDAILKIHDQVQHTKLGAHREGEVVELEAQALQAIPTEEMKGLMRCARTPNRPQTSSRPGPRHSMSSPAGKVPSVSTALPMSVATAAWSAGCMPRRPRPGPTGAGSTRRSTRSPVRSVTRSARRCPMS